VMLKQALLSILFLSFVVGQQLYATVTEFGGKDTETIVYTAVVDPKTGTWSNIVETLVYAGSSATADGISTVDTDNDIVYYATDFEVPFIYATDVKNSLLKAPISLPVYAIARLDYDNVNKRLLALVYDIKKAPILISYSRSSPVTTIFSFAPFGIPYSTAVDAATQTYYFVAVNGSQWYLHSFNLGSPSKVNSYPLTLAPGDYPSYLVYDAKRQTLFGVAENFKPSLNYKLLTMTTNGKVVEKSIATKAFGIATCFTYDPLTHTLYMGWAPNGPGQLYTLDVTTNTVTNVATLPGGIVLEDIEVVP